ncbi:hypothetical protein BS47DRAFT_1386971 [Hydnum rufescens UP504]|uniref:Uncharacterized protein n=1 Tax=Hydnum rufescens UP504 TaxID=1448309 RepID=A0A9P6E2Q5_9AGAM|nr:hypothetical protein BS47DRAFT_1386971 [Hydnum rufescens UP504]
MSNISECWNAEASAYEGVPSQLRGANVAITLAHARMMLSSLLILDDSSFVYPKKLVRTPDRTTRRRYGFGEANVRKRGREKLKKKQGKLRTTDRSKYSATLLMALCPRRERHGWGQRNVEAQALVSAQDTGSRLGSQTSSLYPSRNSGERENRILAGYQQIRVVNFALIIRVHRPDRETESISRGNHEPERRRNPEPEGCQKRIELRVGKRNAKSQIENPDDVDWRSKSELRGIGSNGERVMILTIH